MKCFVVLISIFFAFQIEAAQKKQDANAVMALATASFVNRMTNVEEFLSVMSNSVSPEQMDNFKKQLSLNGVTGKTKIPKMKYDGNKVFFDKQNFIMYVDESTININGHEFKKGIKGIDVVYAEIMAKLNKKSASRFSLIPEAHAMGLFSGLLGMVGTGALGYVLGPALGVSAGWGAVLGAGGFFLGNELYQWWRSGEVSCDNGYYLYRSKTRNGLFAGSKQTPVDYITLGRIFGPNVPPCNDYSAKMVQQGIKNFGGLPQPAGYPPYSGLPAYPAPNTGYPTPERADVTQ